MRNTQMMIDSDNVKS